MDDFKRILVPVDGSEISERAADKAIALAKAAGGSIDFLYVANLTGATGGRSLKHDISLPESVLDQFKEPGNVALMRMLEKVPEGVNAEKHCLTGLPADTILDFSDKVSASVIVMGSRGLNAAQSMLLGSVSQYLVERAKCPVMIVK